MKFAPAFGDRIAVRRRTCSGLHGAGFAGSLASNDPHVMHALRTNPLSSKTAVTGKFNSGLIGDSG
jgi:hypothetical protein